MSYTKGYKCYNIQCGSCIGKTLCGEPGDAAPWCQDRVFDGGIHMDYKNLVEELNRYSAENQNHGGITAQAADAITDLLARAEAVEEGLKQKETYYNQMVDALAATDSFEKQKLCEEADHLKDLLKEAEARAEKAERERNVAIKSIPHKCETCFYNTVGFNGSTIDHDCTNPDGGCSNNYDRWIWRGDKEE